MSFFKNFIGVEFKIQSGNTLIKTNFHVAKFFGIDKLDQIPKDKRIYAGGKSTKGFAMYKAETLNQNKLQHQTLEKYEKSIHFNFMFFNH